MSALQISYILAWALLLVLLAAVAALYSAVGLLIRRGNAALPRVMDAGPELSRHVELPAMTAENEALTEGALNWAFATVDCAGCTQMKEFLRGSSPDRVEPFVLICRGTSQQVAEWGVDLPSWVSLIADVDGAISRSFNATMTPLYVVVDDELVCRSKGHVESTLLSRTKSRSSTGSVVDRTYSAAAS